MYRCQRTHAPHSTHQHTTHLPITPPHITHQRTTRPHMLLQQNTPRHSTAQHITLHHTTRPLTNLHQHTFLHIAKGHGTVQHIAHKHRRSLRLLYRSHLLKELCTSPMTSSFQDIVRRGDLEQIGRFMRARKVRVDTIFHSGMAALHEAVLTGNLDVVKLLVKYGADVHQRDEDGWTPLHMACSDGYPEIARYLLSMGANTEAENESGEKPVDLIDPDCKELAKLFETGCV
uniref:Protein phosphatase 1 regulatory subunit 27 n=1 Tax=Lates calcarifer TaxID=8187 RepID=A0A4W6BPS6_LATCA